MDLQHGQVVIDLCDDDDDDELPVTKSAAAYRGANRSQETRPPPNIVDLSKSPERNTASHDTQASDASLRVPPRKRTGQSSPSSKTSDTSRHSGSRTSALKDRTRPPMQSTSSPRPMAGDGSDGQFNYRKRARQNEHPSSDSGRPDKRQRSLHVPGSSDKARKQSPGKLASNSKTPNNGDFVDLTSDTEEPTSNARDGIARPTDAAVNRRREFSTNDDAESRGRASPHRQKAASTEASDLRPSPLRKKAPRSGGFLKEGSEANCNDERGLEIPESLPGTPEVEKVADKQRELRSPETTRPLQKSVSPLKAASKAVTRLASESSPGPVPWRNKRTLPLTPSESSADEAARRSNKKTSSTKLASDHVSQSGGPATDEARLEERHRSASQHANPTVQRDGETALKAKLTTAQTPKSASTPSVSARNSMEKPQSDNIAGESQHASPPKQLVTGGKRRVPQAAEPAGPKLQKIGGTSYSDSGISTVQHIERAVGHCLDQLQRDNEHWTRTQLQRARCAPESRRTVNSDEPTSVFRKMTPLAIRPHERKKADKTNAKFETEVARSNKKLMWMTPCTTFDTDQEDVPSYSHYVMLKHNFLAPNETTLQHWPYFDDETNSLPQLAEQFNSLYKNDVAHREGKLLLLMKAENYAEHAERMLQDVQCKWSDVLHFLLDAAPNVGDDADAKRALQSRDTFGDIKAFRESRRWLMVLSKLPAALPADIGRAALLCEHFYKLARFSFWHLARRSDYTRSLLEDEAHDTDNLDKLTCRVCLRLSCPYHGEMENPDDDSDSDASSEHSAVETDIINPKRRNYRTRVELPPTVEDGSSKANRRDLHYWQTGTMANLLNKPDERHPFYPCHHPACYRKFSGCNCAKKGKVCFNSESCACFGLGRECDPDLCGSCGVCDVLDPKHSHDDRVLIDRCRNANIQRGHPKHTMIGKSEVHGFGLYVCEPVRQHELIGEYKGEVITTKEAERRGAIYEHQKLSYLFSLNQSQEVDSTFFGNKMRFINHATKAKCNVYARIITVNAVHRICMFAERDIQAGEELYFNYGPRFTFAEEQELKKRGKAQNNTSQSKAVPHVRNANLTKSFYDPDDERGGRAAQKSLGRPPRADRSGRLTTAQAQLRRDLASSSDVEMGEAEDDETDEYEDEEDDEDELYR
ncbi:hypothetical protein PRZ48_001968 [Zasmidium cellare]|uniref:SET domain-containing protein n=1 Tax=Zasmidium cellare TaxID=395010 RepID=A0ABR0F4I5_ZASCE|nr:hypothetical protein PRZ48_001968 [Zasmidium cellare]